jgi:hypothetical protein
MTGSRWIGGIPLNLPAIRFPSQGLFHFEFSQVGFRNSGFPVNERMPLFQAQEEVHHLSFGV